MIFTEYWSVWQQVWQWAAWKKGTTYMQVALHPHLGQHPHPQDMVEQVDEFAETLDRGCNIHGKWTRSAEVKLPGKQIHTKQASSLALDSVKDSRSHLHKFLSHPFPCMSRSMANFWLQLTPLYWFLRVSSNIQAPWSRRFETESANNWSKSYTSATSWLLEKEMERKSWVTQNWKRKFPDAGWNCSRHTTPS